ncbi:MAG: hypothetical protein WA865_20910 [Spirulinaceae cyanobacterium]
MIRNSLLAATLSIAGTTALVTQATAQSIDVPFTGVVQGRCSFNNLIPGVMVSDFPGPGSNKLDTRAPGGSSGAVTVVCNQPADLIVGSPIQTAGPGTAGFVEVDVQSSNGGGSSPGLGGQSLFLPPGQSQLSVDMRVDSPAPLPAGNYGYNVSLTVVP